MMTQLHVVEGLSININIAMLPKVQFVWTKAQANYNCMFAHLTFSVKIAKPSYMYTYIGSCMISTIIDRRYLHTITIATLSVSQ